MEKLRKLVRVSLVTDKKKHSNLVSQPTYVTRKILNEDLVVVQRIREVLLLNKPIYCGMAILEASKRLMFAVHHNVVMREFNPTECDPCVSDTNTVVLSR